MLRASLSLSIGLLLWPIATNASGGPLDAGVGQPENSTRLLIALLSSTNHDNLCTGLANLESNVLPVTPGDIFVWSIDNNAKSHYRTHCSTAVRNGNISFEELGDYWITPPQAGPSEKWHMQDFTESYRRMGHWRLHAPFAFGKAFGYKYMLQIDTDSDVLERLRFNFVEVMNEGKFEIGARTITSDSAIWGLAELTRFYIVGEKITPATLFDHCEPPDMHGLYTSGSDTFTDVDNPSQGGWDGSVLYGNFVLYDLDFWFQDNVQDYVKFVVSTGGHFKFRWNEQAVVAMVWQLFVPKEKFKQFSFAYRHTGR